MLLTQKGKGRRYGEGSKSSAMEHKSFVTRSQLFSKLQNLQQDPFLKDMVCERLQCGCHKKSGEVTSGSLSQLANPPYKILTKDKSSTSPSPPPLLTCCCLEHQEEESTEERQDPHGWEVPARSQLWGEEKGGRDEQECPCLLRDGTEERGQPVQDET